MNLLAVMAALALEQWRAFRWRIALERAFIGYAHWIEERLNGGTVQQGVIAAVAALAPPVALAAGVSYALEAVHPLWGLAWNIVVLYLLMGFRRFSHAYTDIITALRAGDIAAARRALAGWRGASAGELSTSDIAKLAIERGLVDSYRQVFAVMFWFSVLPGPVGAVLYRATVLLTQEWRGDARGTEPTPIGRARAIFGEAGAPAAVAARLGPGAARCAVLSPSSAISRTRAYCWRTQARRLGEGGGRRARRHPARGGRRRARRRPGRARSRCLAASPTCGRRSAPAIRPTPTSSPAPSASCGGCWCCGCC